jgi:hypothetical protein
MKNPDHIKRLIEAYYEGNTSLEEEMEIREFFRAGDVPGELEAEAGLFAYFGEEGHAPVNENLESRILHEIESRGEKTGNAFTRWRYYWISGAAAAILVLVAVFIDMSMTRNKSFVVKQDTYEDPYLAYAEAKKVLHYVSEKMNTSTEPLKNLEKLNSGMDYMQPVFSFGPGIQMLEYLNTIDKTKELISK